MDSSLESVGNGAKNIVSAANEADLFHRPVGQAVGKKSFFVWYGCC
jgi:hypothetical protein